MICTSHPHPFHPSLPQLLFLVLSLPPQIFWCLVSQVLYLCVWNLSKNLLVICLFCFFGVVCVLYVNVFNSPDNVRWFPPYWPACGMCTMTASEQHFEIYMYKSLCKDWLIILSYHSYKQLLLFLPMRDSGLARLLFLFSVGWMCWILRAVVMPRPVRESCLDLSWNHAWNHT